MLTNYTVFRQAASNDATELADLINMAGDGLPLQVWREMVGPGENPWDIGRARQVIRAKAGEVFVAEVDGNVVGSLTGSEIGDSQQSIEDDIPALFRPLIELENEALSSWYINAIAIYPGHRGKGLLQEFLSISESRALAAGLTRVSAIVAGNKTGPIKVYQRFGFVVSGKRKFERGTWKADFDDWVLLIKNI